MNDFPFSEKKLLSLSSKNRHRRIALWIKRIYLAYAADSSRTVPPLFFSNYEKILTWLGEKPSARPHDFEVFLLNRFHYHWGFVGQNLNEGDYPSFSVLDNFDREYQPVVKGRVLLDNVRSAYNVGAIYRTVDAFGWQGVIHFGFTPSPDSRSVSKVALGTEKWIPNCRTENLEEIKSLNCRLVALETYDEAISVQDYDWNSPFIVMLGNEEYGIRAELLRIADDHVKIPMSGKKNSLNISTCFSALAFTINQKLGIYR